MAIVIAGGMVASVLASLFVMPLLYVRMKGIQS
jgi:multidrug efflux pump subunit AcrB